MQKLERSMAEKSVHLPRIRSPGARNYGSLADKKGATIPMHESDV